MIWAVVTKDEMENYKIPPVFRYYREVLGKENINLVVVGEEDPLDFVAWSDMVLLRSANKRLIDTIHIKGLLSTAEQSDVYRLVQDKKQICGFLNGCAIKSPKQYESSNLKENHVYFVKPRFGSESFGITKDCICHTVQEAFNQVCRIERELQQEAVIEDFIDGTDCTVACYIDPYKGEVKSHAIEIECDEVGGIQTHTGKFDYNEYCSPLSGKELSEAKRISKDVFRGLGLKHHARIDFRKSKDGSLYVIDVNLIPGLGPSAHFAKCLLLTENLSYKDAINAVVNSASR